MVVVVIVEEESENSKEKERVEKKGGGGGGGRGATEGAGKLEEKNGSVSVVVGWFPKKELN